MGPLTEMIKTRLWKQVAEANSLTITSELYVV